MRENETTILAVDDIEDNLDLLEFALKRKPIKLYRATSGKECIALAIEHQPDVILLDIQMPEMDGYQTLQLLREHSRTANIPVVLLTAQRKDPESIEKGLILGADEYLTKPIDTDELLVRTKTLVRLKRAEAQLERTKADFMAMLVHDLRSPLTGIKMVIDFIVETGEEQKSLTDEHFELLGAAQDSTKHMLNLINDLMDLSKFEAGNIQLDLTTVPVSIVLQQIQRKMQLRFREKGVSLDIQVPPDLPPVHADSMKIEQVFMNLVTNSLKFTPEGGRVTLTAQERMEPEKRAFMEFSISDTGVGISADEVPQLFGRYKQTTSARKTSEKGTGLGLSICKLIVEAHGGTIGAESEPGKGTRIRFTVPMASMPQPTMERN